MMHHFLGTAVFSDTKDSPGKEGEKKIKKRGYCKQSSNREVSLSADEPHGRWPMEHRHELKGIGLRCALRM
jgi:hypothetical protein